MGRHRTPVDGRPFYCETCGAGWAEYVACEMPDCALESAETAQERQRIRKAGNKNILGAENKAQMNALVRFARIWPFVYRCQVLVSHPAFLSNRARNTYKPGLAAIFGKPICYNVSVGGNSAAALFDIARRNP